MRSFKYHSWELHYCNLGMHGYQIRPFYNNRGIGFIREALESNPFAFACLKQQSNAIQYYFEAAVDAYEHQLSKDT